MDALQALLSRQSIGKLSEPAPTPEQRQRMYRAALRAPDHARLRPWRFLEIAGEGRHALGDLFVCLLQEAKPDAATDEVDRERQKPLRAPLIIVVIARLQDHPKVPQWEQLLSAGCAAHALLLAAHAQGLGAIWRTGPPAEDARVDAALGLQAGERIVGFLYVGTPAGRAPALETPNPDGYVQSWP